MKKPVTQAARDRYFRIYERFLVQRALGDRWDAFGGIYPWQR